VHPAVELEVHICAHQRARYELVSVALHGLETAGLSRVGFVELDPANRRSCRTGAPSQ
jgi:hypothetical protein